MRVITGRCRGRKLQTLPGEEARPTSAVVKEALFNAIQFEIEGTTCLDLFAGSGQLGIEALSRGAKYCYFVDKSRACIQVVRQNLEHTELIPEAGVFQQEWNDFLQGTKAVFDLAFLDPPYAQGLLPEVLTRLEPHMSEIGVAVCESDSSSELPEEVGGLTRSKEYRYGKRKITIYRRKVVR